MIIGITGTLGAGKGTVVEHLVARHGFSHFSVREFLKEEIARRGMIVNRDAMVGVANDLRARFGAAYIVTQLCEQARDRGGHVAVESIRTIGEAEYLRSIGAFLWAVDADPVVRYRRIALRATETDRVSLETFLSNERREMHSVDAAKQNIAGVVMLADVVLRNDGTLSNLHARVDDVLRAVSL